MYQKIEPDHIYLGSKRNNLPQYDKLEEIISRIRFCSCALINNYKDLETLYRFDKHTLKTLLNKKSPKIVQLVDLLQFHNIEIQTDLSPYINVNLTCKELDCICKENKQKIINILTNKINQSNKNNLYTHHLNKQLVEELLETSNKNKEKVDSILKLFELFNIKLIFPNLINSYSL